ncbi:MAG: hypothetical protein AAGC81_01870 [Pseudomonadota bacterium]
MPIKEWRARQSKLEIEEQLKQNMAQAMLFSKGKVQISLNRGNPSGENPSRPGEPPRKVSGRLFQSIATEVVNLPGKIVGRYGTNVEYARRLELGFSGRDANGRNVNQPPRPFLRPVLKSFGRQILRIIGRD